MAEAREAPTSSSPFLRTLYCLIQGGAFVVFEVLCWVTKRFEQIYDQLGMTQLPPPTLLFIGLARFGRSPVGVAMLTGCLVLLVVLAQRGTFDARLKKFIWGNLLGVVGLSGLMTLTIFMPIAKIQQALNDK